jgi:SAM-dependent methyltransferase
MTDIQLERVPACDLCAETRFTPLLTSPDQTECLVSGTFQVVRCGCGLAFLDPRPTLEDIAKVYPSDYSPHAARTVTVARWQRTRSGRERASTLARVEAAIREYISFHFFPAWRGDGRVLDVGCGAGSVLDVLKELGWTTHGVDVGANVVEAIGRRGHIARQGVAEAIDFPDASFDVVMLSHVLEHTFSPRKALAEARRVLRPGGQLLVAVPNFGSLQARVFRRFWASLDVPRHLYQFTPRTLRRYLEESGFHSVRVRSRTGATTFPKTARMLANGLLGRRWRKDPTWAVVPFEPVALASGLFTTMGTGADLRVTAER